MNAATHIVSRLLGEVEDSGELGQYVDLAVSRMRCTWAHQNPGGEQGSYRWYVDTSVNHQNAWVGFIFSIRPEVDPWWHFQPFLETNPYDHRTTRSEDVRYTYLGKWLAFMAGPQNLRLEGNEFIGERAYMVTKKINNAFNMPMQWQKQKGLLGQKITDQVGQMIRESIMEHPMAKRLGIQEQ